MTYRTLLVHLDASRRCAARVAMAGQWARAHDAHLVGLVPTGLYDGIIPADAVALGGTEFIAQSAQFLRERAERISREFRDQLGAVGALSYEVRLVDGTAIDAVVEHGRCSDLVVLGQYDSEDRSSEFVTTDLPPGVLMELGGPVLLLPHSGHFEGPATKVLVAWDGSAESAVAIHGALPALQRAARVTLISFRRPQRSGQPPARPLVPEMLQYLLRQGVEAQAEDAVTEINVADALLSRVSDLDVDLLVMGGYGHSRFRELVLGGTTRQILAEMTVPVLMAH